MMLVLDLNSIQSEFAGFITAGFGKNYAWFGKEIN